MSGDARARKTDTVASKMGDMLLKGYKMLAVSCDVCNNVLMQDKQGNNICVSCTSSEPVGAAKVGATSGRLGQVAGHPSSAAPEASTIGGAIDILDQEIITTSCLLGATNDFSSKMQLVSYMCKCAETINFLKK